MNTLDRNLRKELENTVTKARKVAESGAIKVLEQLAVHHHEPWGSMTPLQRVLRNRLRAHGRQLGDQRDSVRGSQSINRLATELAYEHWHRMLFARFLAEADLLIEPDSGAPLTLDECQELAQAQGADWMSLASLFAERMLPQIFRSGDPVLEVGLSPENRSELEDLLKALPSEVFLADDSLGWVYQFWQVDRKKEVNDSGIKIGANELPAVTQFFTEDYMVNFILHNTLGAWWAGKVLELKPELARTAISEAELRSMCCIAGIEWEYLRFIKNEDGRWQPAAGTFEGWSKETREIKLLDPSMGSGHFLVAALPILMYMRMAEEGLSRNQAIESVLRDNIYGLEIDSRCTQIAAFNLAFSAWRIAGFRALPQLHLACSGLSPGVSKSEWLKLAEEVANNILESPERDLFGRENNLFTARIESGLESLYELFAKAPSLGSLIDPQKSVGNLYEAGYHELEPLLAPLLARHNGDEIEEMAVAAQGLSKAAEILSEKFTLVVTNVPYLGRSKQEDVIKDYCANIYPTAQSDIATCFIDRCVNFCKIGGTATFVAPQGWQFQTTYKKFRGNLLSQTQWNFLARLGSKAFQTPMWDFNILLMSISRLHPAEKHKIACVDISEINTAEEKSIKLITENIIDIFQKEQFSNPDLRIVFQNSGSRTFLSEFCETYKGICSGDRQHFQRCFWEVRKIETGWAFQQSSIDTTDHYKGRESIFYWEDGKGDFYKAVVDRLGEDGVSAWIRGEQAWGRQGIAVRVMGNLPVTRYSGEIFDNNVAVIVVKNIENLPAIWAFSESIEYNSAVRQLNQKISVTDASFIQVPVDLNYWKKIAQEKYPEGLPKPFSAEPTQWLFNGHPNGSDNPLHVAVARLLCYRWPRQTGSSFIDCPEIGTDTLEKYIDDDGIVCLNPLKGEPPAAERLNALLAEAYGDEWSAAKQASLLTQIGYAGNSLEDWLRDEFFTQHCELFYQRPFIWHIWDGRRDGFHALVNYHMLAGPGGEGRRTLDKLIYTYLGDWIDGQRRDQTSGIEGADARLVAAEHLKTELEKIRHGEPPYDIFVRWKPLHQQSIGWEPDINDGVRLNIRPFMIAKPYGSKASNACILRTTPKNIKWDKDRGKEPERKRDEFPWFWSWDGQAVDFAGKREYDGNRWNDLHYSTEFKRAARAQQGS